MKQGAMAIPAKFDWGREVLIIRTAPVELCPGQRGWVVGIQDTDGGWYYTVELEDGSDRRIGEEYLELPEAV